MINRIRICPENQRQPANNKNNARNKIKRKENNNYFGEFLDFQLVLINNYEVCNESGDTKQFKICFWWLSRVNYSNKKAS